MPALAFVTLSLCPVAWHGLEGDSLMRVNEVPLEPELVSVHIRATEVGGEGLMVPQGYNSSPSPSLDSCPLSNSTYTHNRSVFFLFFLLQQS